MIRRVRQLVELRDHRCRRQLITQAGTNLCVGNRYTPPVVHSRDGRAGGGQNADQAGSLAQSDRIPDAVRESDRTPAPPGSRSTHSQRISNPLAMTYSAHPDHTRAVCTDASETRQDRAKAPQVPI